MSTAIAIFAKTPGLSPLKTRLAAGIGKEQAEDFYKLSLKAVEETFKQVKQATPYWIIREEEALNHPLWSAFKTLHTGEINNLGECQYAIYETLLKEYDNVILVGSDTPQISTALIEETITTLKENDFVIGPANDGGYYLFGGRVNTKKEMWINVSWSTETTRQELQEQLPSKTYDLAFLTDIDEQEDLKALKNEMPKMMNEGQKELTQWLEKITD